MSEHEVADFLRRYNRWRKGDESLEMPHPERISEALDRAADLVASLSSGSEKCIP